MLSYVIPIHNRSNIATLTSSETHMYISAKVVIRTIRVLKVDNIKGCSNLNPQIKYVQGASIEAINTPTKQAPPHSTTPPENTQTFADPSDTPPISSREPPPETVAK